MLLQETLFAGGILGRNNASFSGKEVEESAQEKEKETLVEVEEKAESKASPSCHSNDDAIKVSDVFFSKI